MDAIKRSGIPQITFDWASFSVTLNDQIGLAQSHSLAHRKDQKFTHLLNVANPDMYRWWLESADHLYKIAVTADSPWDWSQYEKQMDLWDLLFVNDKSISEYYKSDKIIYLPVAYGHDAKQIIVDDPKYHSDVCFVGTVYPNRVPYLEAILEYCQTKGYNFILRGGLKYVPDDSPLHGICKSEIVDHWDTIKYYSNSKIVINTHRDEYWMPQRNAIFNKLELEAYSLNPRFYELAMCKTFQLMESNRQEIENFHGCCAIFTDVNNMLALIDRALTRPGFREEYIKRAYEKIKEHSYVNRFKVILEKIGFYKNQLHQPIFN